MLDYSADRFCPAYKRVIDDDLCYESMSCLSGQFRKSSVPELEEIKDIDAAVAVCSNCPYSDMYDGGEQ